MSENKKNVKDEQGCDVDVHISYDVNPTFRHNSLRLLLIFIF